MRLPLVLLLGFAVLAVGCDKVNAPATGAIRVTVNTAGVDLDPDGYSIRVEDELGHPAVLNGSITIAGVRVGQRLVRVEGLAVNCQPTEYSTRFVNVTADDTVDVVFDIKCRLLIGNISVAANTLGANVDADG